MSDEKDRPELYYFGDPMCSWCWGFSPVLEKLEGAFDVPLHVVAGGLAPGAAARPMGDKMAEVIAHHWHSVEEMTGQPFNHKVLERRGWSYDTEPACIAVVTMRDQAPGSVLPFFSRLHRAFYVEGIDITDPTVYGPLVAPFVEDVPAFLERMASDEMKAMAWQDFSMARSLGVSSFPTLLVRTGDQWAQVCRGWASFESIEPGLRAFLDERLATVTEGEACDIDGC